MGPGWCCFTKPPPPAALQLPIFRTISICPLPKHITVLPSARAEETLDGKPDIVRAQAPHRRTRTLRAATSRWMTRLRSRNAMAEDTPTAMTAMAMWSMLALGSCRAGRHLHSSQPPTWRRGHGGEGVGETKHHSPWCAQGAGATTAAEQRTTLGSDRHRCGSARCGTRCAPRVWHAGRKSTRSHRRR